MRTSIHPATFEPRYVDLRTAMADGKVTKREVEKYIKPYFRDTWTDDIYFRTLSELSNGSTQTGMGTVRATRGARELLGDILAWE